MAWQQTPYTLPMLLSAGVSVAIILALVRNRSARGAVSLVAVMVGAAVWSLALAGQLASVELAQKLLFNNFRYVGTTLAPIGIFVFVVQYTDRGEWLTTRNVALLAIVPVLDLVVVATERFHDLMRADVGLQSTAGFLQLVEVHGPYFYFHAAYAYALMAGAVYLLVKRHRKTEAWTYRGQTTTLIVAAIIPWFANGFFLAGVTSVDLTPMGFTLTGLLLAVSMYRYQLFDIVPIARSKIIDDIEEGFMVLDAEDRIVDINAKAAEYLQGTKSALVGTTIQTVYADHPAVLARFERVQDGTDEISLEQDGETRHYHVEISSIEDTHGEYQGRVVLIRDETERIRRDRQLREQKAELERQNERLEDFAGIVSHDLRNPINVIEGYLDVAAETGDPEHFEAIEESLDRMLAIIDDVLALARQGQTVTDPEVVTMAALAEAAWSNVDTREATLEVDGDLTFEADRNRMLQIFENLFRNAIDHGRDDVTVRVAVTDGGFCIEDDGHGIPVDERDEVFEQGYTTHAEGTGFGLSIVQTAAEAHGWGIEVTEGSMGGACFRFQDVEERGSDTQAKVPVDD